MATRTASVSGNWADAATWGGAAAPVSGDTANINGDVVVTVAAGTTATCYRLWIGQSNNSTGISTVINNGTLNVEELLVVGNGALKDGKFTFGPDSVTNVTSALQLRNCYINSTATAGHWAKLTGSISSGGTGPRQDFQPQYVSFQTSGTTDLVLQDTTGAATSKFLPVNCVWANARDLTIGSTTTPAATPMQFVNCDFDNITVGHTITMRKIDGGTVAFGFSHCSFRQSGAGLKIKPTTSTGFIVDNCVGLNASVEQAATSGALTVSNSLLANALNTTSAIGLSDASTGANLISGNYILGLAASDNHRAIDIQSSGGSGSNTVTGNIFETPAGASYDEGDFCVCRGDSLNVLLSFNTIIKCATLTTGGRVAAWATNIKHRNNSVIANVASSVAFSGSLFDPEGYPTTGSVDIANQLHVGNGSLGGSGISLVNAGSGGNQTIAYSDYNDFVDITTPYGSGLTVTAGNSGTPPSVPAAHDIITNPNFFDTTRNGAKWNLYFGSGTNSAEDFVTFWLNGLNGYRGSANYDQGGTVTGHILAQAIAWVRYGYSPTNLVLRGAGAPADGSPDIGAMPVRTKAPAGAF